MKQIILKKGKSEALRRFHPWIFSGAIAVMDNDVREGDIVSIVNEQRKIVATGFYSDASIAVRILSFAETDINQSFWDEKLTSAFQTRCAIDLIDNADTNCYRLVHAEGDGLSGLVIDFYNGVAVVQCHAVGMHRMMDFIVTGLKHILQHRLIAVYDKSHETLPAVYVAENTITNGYRFSSENLLPVTPHICSENGNRFAIDWITGQKTGFFLDQRDNRAALEKYVAGKKVLNAFCYSGGFSVYALEADASEVCSVDISPKAMDLTRQNIDLMHDAQNAERSSLITSDVIPFLKEHETMYDVVIVDPPAFAKSVSKRHNAVQAYKRLNEMALRRVVSGGILFTFSCSQVVDRQLFYDTIVAAAIEAKRNVRVLQQLTQGADHPVNIFHPEGSYLKGLVLYVE
jgi:23S rRNA (cytosine1962-C5)-methyltransferase